MNDLIKKAKNGDSDAFTELIQKHLQLMYKTARTILNSDEDIADAVQDTILCCWEKINQLNKHSTFRAWLTKILINKCYDLLRKKKNLVLFEKIPEEESPAYEFENVEWNMALQKLDEKYRTIIILYYVEGFKTREISRILDIPEATIRTRLKRARAQMANIYEIPMERRK